VHSSKKGTLSLLGCLLLSCAVTAGDGRNSEIEKKNAADVDVLFHATAQGRYPGAAVGIIRDGQPVLMKGYGLSDVEKGTPITSSTIFRIGSLTKSFTAIAILQLEDNGKLRLDDPVAKYLPDFPHGGEIQIRYLLSHTGGVPDFVSYEEVKKMSLEFTPGTRINYSNTGYDMLGMIIEKASRQKYEEYLQEHIFEPAGMKHSGYDRRAELPGRARGYLLDGKGAYTAIAAKDVAGAFAAGGLYSNVEDLGRWLQALGAGKLLRQELLQQASTPYQLTDGRQTAYGFGFMTGSYRGLREYGHGGDIEGFNAYLMRFPKQNFAVIVLSNTGMRPPGPVPDAGAIAYHIADIYLADSLEKPTAVLPVHIAPGVLDSYVGRYQVQAPGPILDAMGSYLTITRDGEQLAAESKLGKNALEAISQTTFRASGSPAELTFVRNGEGKVSQMIITLGGLREFPANRVD